MNDKQLLSELRIDPAQRAGSDAARTVWPLLFAASVLLVIAGVAAVMFLGGHAVEVEIAVAELPAPGASRAVLEATGYVTARRQATVASKVTGKLIEVLFEEGDRVEEGQVLARLDDTSAKAQLGVARAQIDAARARLGELQAQIEQAERDLARQQNLKERGLTAQQLLDNAETLVTSLEAQLKAQREQIGVAEAQLKVAEVDEADTVIRAPFAGVVIAKAAQPGEMVSPISAGGGYTRTGIGTIVDMDSLEIEVDVNEAFINRVTPGQPVEAVLDAYPEWKIPAEVIAIIPAADRSKATVRVRIAIKAKDPRIVPDMGVHVTYLDETQAAPVPSPGGVRVPAGAVVERDGRDVVFIVSAGYALRRDVRAGADFGGQRLVESGIKAGQQVVVNPPADLSDGQRVKSGQGGASG
ncbi:MAG: efflux RND transporter periplasmic adaptor subunit [Gammaproteobacteria bacterium]|nr:efflux RND transporter periplasmic adaptor subunit [Gammaproteobacteria bacterium]